MQGEPMPIRSIGLLVGLIALPALAQAAAPAPHLRGRAVAIQGDELTLKTFDGDTKTVKLSSTTRYVDVRKSSLDAIDKNAFIGTATKDVGSRLVALEVVVFPEAMRGAGEGHYDWDAMPDTTLSGGGKVSSTMTNGTVSAASGTGGKVNSTMTNGTVATASAAGGAKQITVTYKGGEQQIVVPPNVPVVTLAPGSRDDIKVGSVLIVTTT